MDHFLVVDQRGFLKELHGKCNIPNDSLMGAIGKVEIKWKIVKEGTEQDPRLRFIVKDANGETLVDSDMAYVIYRMVL